MPYFNIVAETTENTVITEYEPVPRRSDSYQSEAELEKEFIRLLTEQGYTYLNIHKEADLIANLRERWKSLITLSLRTANGSSSLLLLSLILMTRLKIRRRQSRRIM